MKSYTQELLDEMEAAGKVVRSGEMRPDDTGRLQPAYVIPRFHPAIAALLKANPNWTERAAVEYARRNKLID